MAELIELSAQSTAASGGNASPPRTSSARTRTTPVMGASQNHRVLVGGAIRCNGRDFAIKADIDYEEHRKRCTATRSPREGRPTIWLRKGGEVEKEGWAPMIGLSCDSFSTFA